MGDVVKWGMRVPFAKPMIGAAEKIGVLDVMSQSILTDGPKTAEFEEGFRNFCGGGVAVAVSSCTAALHLAWSSLIEPGDEVIIPALTHAATAMAVEAAGGVVKLADVGPDGNMTPQTLAAAVTPKTKGVCVVHFLGRAAPMQALMDVVKVPFVEDCALSLGATIGGRHVGLFGSAGAFSFYPCKHMTTGEGGMVLTTDTGLAAFVKSRRAFGKAIDGKGDISFARHGINYRMSEIAAAIGIAQLARLKEIFAARRRNAVMLIEALEDSVIGFDYAISYVAETPELAEALTGRLRTRSIETSRYYPQPIHKLAYYSDIEGEYPEAERLSACSVTLPVGPHVTAEKIGVMIETIREME